MEQIQSLYTAEDIRHMLKCSKTTLFRLLKKGEFPPPMKVGRFNRWQSQVVQQWLDNQATSKGA